MTADEYVAQVVRKYAVRGGPNSAAERAALVLSGMISQWAGRNLKGFWLSGSYAKGTAISLGTDVDVFISLDDPRPVKEIYWSLFQFCVDRGLRPQARNVSVRVESNGMKVDLVPGRIQDPTSGKTGQTWGTPDHTLYRRKKDSWMQTNVGKHIALVRESGMADEIRAMKVWKERHRVEVPSFYLEMVVVEALNSSGAKALGSPEDHSARLKSCPDTSRHTHSTKGALSGAPEYALGLRIPRAFSPSKLGCERLGMTVGQKVPPLDRTIREANHPASVGMTVGQECPTHTGLGARMARVLKYVAEEFERARVIDPANTNNVISDDLGAEEKGTVARAARKSLGMSAWESVIW